LTPSLGFSYTNASFDNLTLAPGSPFAPTLNLGVVKSELGRVGLTVGDTFATTYWTLTPNLTGSVWHEFAGETPTLLNAVAPGQFFTDSVTESRLGTFGQIGLGLLAQPVLNPNWTLFARADYRTGSNIYGATITAGFRYQF
jgi:outer membrane autotransporter protein